MILETIYTAILSRYNETPLVTMVEGLFFCQAPRNQTGSYIVYTPIAQRQEYDMSSRLEDTLIQFRVFASPEEENEGAALALGVGETLMAVFDDTTLDIPGGTLVRIDRQSHNIFPDPDGGWIYQIDYALLVQEGS